MNPEQAKEILSAYRPGSDDEHDPVFSEARQLAQSDRELAAWLQERQAFDQAVRRRLGELPKPPLPSGELLAGVAHSQSGPRRSRRVPVAMAACLVLCVTLAGYWLSKLKQHEATQFAACRHDMVQLLRQFPHLDLETESLTQARRWLSETHHLQQIEVPAGLQRFPTIGCRTLDWHGRSLALVCFVVDGEIVHLILIPRGEIPGGPPSSKPQFLRETSTSSVAWSHGDLTYLILSKANVAFLRARL